MLQPRSTAQLIYLFALQSLHLVFLNEEKYQNIWHAFFQSKVLFALLNSLGIRLQSTGCSFLIPPKLSNLPQQVNTYIMLTGGRMLLSRWGIRDEPPVKVGVGRRLGATPTVAGAA